MPPIITWPIRAAVALFVALVAVLAVQCAFADFDVTATMPQTSGATTCRLYLDGVAVGTPSSCGAAIAYPALVANPGTYVLTYTASNGAGESAQSLVTKHSIVVIPPPDDPLAAPAIA